ncbi:MAG TPA: carbon-nitrogen hydrolase family protein [Syntrophorhabdales bacterium]|nr:carbon-nitrogen hydrolase family protein [Syntrophorhabdales bacterium]
MRGNSVSEAGPFRAALVQMSPLHLEKPTNVERMERFIHEGAKAGARLIVLPELIVTGYVSPEAPDDRARFYEASEKIPGPTTQRIGEVADRAGVYVIFGMAERGESRLGPVMHNAAVMVGPRGFLCRHRKIHLPGEEKLYFAAGNDVEVFETDLGKITLLVCYDLWFPETARIAGLKGAQIIVDCANWPSFDTDPWFAMGPGIAASNILWFVQVNRVGGEPSWPGFGGSQIVSPSGRVVARGTDDESIVYGEIDTAEIMKRRGETPVWFDRRPDLYGAITSMQP